MLLGIEVLRDEHRISCPGRIAELRRTITHNRGGSGLFPCLSAVPVIFAGVRNRKEQTPALRDFTERGASSGIHCEIARRSLDGKPADLDRFEGGSRLSAAQWSQRQPNRVWFVPSTYSG